VRLNALVSSIFLASLLGSSVGMAQSEIFADDFETGDLSRWSSWVGYLDIGWHQVQRDAGHSGYVSQTVTAPYTVLWSRDTAPVSSRVQPIVALGLVILPSNDGSLDALRCDDGDLAWSFETGGPLVNSAAYANGRVFVGSTDHSVFSVNIGSGSLDWAYETGGSVKAAPVVAEGLVFIGASDGCMYALDQTTGDPVWTTCIGAPIVDTAAYDNGRVFFGGMDSVGYALDAGTGSINWSVPIPGQGFRDRWTVAGNGHVFFTPMIWGSHHGPLNAGTSLFHVDAVPTIYDQPWAVQRQAILDHLVAAPFFQPLVVLEQTTGAEAFVPPVLYASGGSQSPHSQVVLLPNGNANVIYRRSFGEAAQWGATTSDALFTGELDLTTGDIIPVDRCQPGSGGWADCGFFTSAFTSDESAALIRSGDVIYLDVARGTYGLDTVNELMLPTVACYSDGMGFPYYLPDCLVTYPDYQPPPTGWRVHYDNLLAEIASDGNDLKRPTPIVGDVLYVLHYNTLVAVQGTIAGSRKQARALEGAPADGRAISSTAPRRPSQAGGPRSLDVAAELERVVAEIVDAGHMAPAFYYKGLGAHPEVFYATPCETITTLSLAYPHLPADLQAEVKAFLDAEILAYPPHSQGYYPPYSGTMADLVGARRELFAPKLDEPFNIWPGVPVSMPVLAAVWRYSSSTGDWTYATANYAALRTLYFDFRSSGSIESYPDLSGVLGFAHIAEHLAQTADFQDASAFAQVGLVAGEDFDQFLITARSEFPNGSHNSTTPVFMFHRAPVAVHFDAEIGQHLHEHAVTAVTDYVAEIAAMIPLWWLTGAAMSHGENAYTTPEISWTAFMLHAYVLNTPADELIRMLDAPDRKGDLLYIQKLVALLDRMASNES